MSLSKLQLDQMLFKNWKSSFKLVGTFLTFKCSPYISDKEEVRALGKTFQNQFGFMFKIIVVLKVTIVSNFQRSSCCSPASSLFHHFVQHTSTIAGKTSPEYEHYATTTMLISCFLRFESLYSSKHTSYHYGQKA